MKHSTKTAVYSSASVEKLNELLDEILLTFGVYGVKPEDLFYTGVFCNITTYANFKDWDESPLGVKPPETLTSHCTSAEEKMRFVKDTITEIMHGDAEKPRWMLFIEENEFCSTFEFSPPTYLYLEAKDEKYKALGEKLIDFLYSVNLVTHVYDQC